ncbi:hypothetical protein BDV98DRAFT_75297 [Pterulicium gracile]|uniref:Uncharacterized protein n=1 Tax=Pterulicium gracile TaxID=1884261 RepID=A0A5C3QJD2_9AGAR|nr:hypothetical protein BDV98DRAFT_75297 [Pterula gracilis]
MKLTSIAYSLLPVALASATTMVDLSSRGDQVFFRGNITAPRVDLLLPPRRTFDFTYRPSNWCGNAYSGVSAWITRTSVVSVNSTGGIDTGGDSFGVLWKYGDWLQPYNPVLNPPTAGAPPATLSMPDFTSLGIVPGTVYFHVVETAENCVNPWGGSTQYGLASVRLINT